MFATRLLCLFVGLNASLLFASTVTVTIPSTAGPWSQSLNPAFNYANLHENTPPVVIDASSGVAFYPGGSLTITYASGAVSAGVGYPASSADGQLDNLPIGCDPQGFGCYPAFYMNPVLNVYLVELVGTFANDGVIVGTPFPIGNGPTTLTIPAGANQLLLGINDAYYTDNSGEFVVTVSSPFNLSLLYDASKPAKSGSTIAIKIQLTGYLGENLSSGNILVHATGVIQTSNLISGPAEDAGNANPDSDFRYDPTIGGTGGYVYNLKTTGLTTGTYRLNFTVFGEAYGAPFQVK